MSIADTRTALRTLLSGSSSTMLASVFDPLSARIAEDLRYEAALMGGSIASHVVLGAPDLIVLTLTELAEQVHRCTRASRVPLLVDGDLGGLGIRLYSTGHQPFAVAVNALYEAMKAVREGALPSALSGIAPKSLIDQLTRNALYAESVQLYLGANRKSA